MFPLKTQAYCLLATVEWHFTTMKHMMKHNNAFVFHPKTVVMQMVPKTWETKHSKMTVSLLMRFLLPADIILSSCAWLIGRGLE